jgi:methionyl-tRNA synthetase
MLREVTFGLDGDFSYKALIHRINTELANDFGNLATRTLGMITKYFEGTIPKATEFADEDKAIHTLIAGTATNYVNNMNELAFSKALSNVWELVWALNKYIDDMQPWALQKDPALQGRLGTVLYTAVDGLRAISCFIAPFMPETAMKLRSQLGLNTKISLESEKDLGISAIMPSGGKLGEVTALFPRIDEKEMMASLQQDNSPLAEGCLKGGVVNKEEIEPIAMSDFEKIRIIAGKVEAAEKVAKSEKLLKLTVNDGSGVRTIVAGIAKSYEPQDLLGKTVAILDNLKPAKLMGVESHGMVLAAFDGERHHALILPDDVPAGTRIK